MKKMSETLFIFNPHSGKGTINSCVADIKEILESKGSSVDVYATSGPLDAQRKIQADAERYSLIVCAGGDGTLSEVVSGMMQLKVRPPIGFIPVGSTNDTRPGFGLPKDILDAARLCLNGNPHPTDVGKFNDEYFAYVASFGSLSAVSCFTPQEMKRIWGHGAYLVEGIKQFIKMESCELRAEFNGTCLEGDFFLGFITNSLSLGGFEGITGGAVDLADGLFEAAFLRKPRNLMEIAKEVDQVWIHNKEDSRILDDLVVRFKTDRIVIKSDKPVQWVKDGENGGMHREAVIEVCNKAVKIISSN